MYQRINDCYVFFIAIYNNHKWALVVPCDTGDITYLGGNLCGILCVILCGRELHTEPSHFRVFKFLGKLRK